MRKRFELKVGGRYKSFSGEEFTVIREMEDKDFPFIAVDSKRNLHKFTRGGWYTNGGFNNHPLNLLKEL